MEMMVKMTQHEAIGFGMRTMATTSMMAVPAIRQLMVEG
jgi:hypothetical protein